MERSCRPITPRPPEKLERMFAYDMWIMQPDGNTPGLEAVRTRAALDP